MSERIVLFDGVCNLCNASVQFIIKNDPKGKIKFAALQSDAGQSLLKKHELPLNEFYSIIFIHEDKIYQQSEAILQIARELRPPLSWVYPIGKIIPLIIRDRIYQWISKNRYPIFGRRAECMIPTADLQRRFL